MSGSMPPSFKARYDSALALHREARYADSQLTIEHAFWLLEMNGSPPWPTVRDGALLQARNLYHLGEYEGCRRWMRKAQTQRFLQRADLAADCIELWIRVGESDYPAAIRGASRRLDKCERREPALLVVYHGLLAYAWFMIGDAKKALAASTIARELSEIHDRPRERARILNLMGIMLMEEGRYGEAVTNLQQSLEINTSRNEVLRAAQNNLNLGIVYYKQGDYRRSQRALDRAWHSLARNSGPTACNISIALATLNRLRRDFKAARQHVAAAHKIAKCRSALRHESLALGVLGDIYRDCGNEEEARRYYARALQIAHRIAPEGGLVMSLLQRDGECLEKMGRQQEAEPLLIRALDMACQVGKRFDEGIILRCLAATRAKLGDPATAQEHIGKALNLLSAIEARQELAITHLYAASICAARCLSGEEILKHASAPGELAPARPLPGEKLPVDGAVPYSRPEAEISAAPTRTGEKGIVAVSAQMCGVLGQCEVYAPHRDTLLITGETGSGKELVARRVHELSERRDAPFVAVNCASVPDTLFEREFFGHRSGAFSGADGGGSGFVAQAQGGTLFLDEISELSLALQPKLLRLLEESVYRRLGDPRERTADVRFIAATNADLDAWMTEGAFRRDLYYRLQALTIRVPPLRERRDDIIPLLNHYLSLYNKRSTTVWAYFNEDSIRLLLQYAWPGNVRQVKMTARRAQLSLAIEKTVHVELEADKETLVLTGPGPIHTRGLAGSEPMIRTRIIGLLQATDGNKAKTARRLGISRKTLYRWLDRLDISH